MSNKVGLQACGHAVTPLISVGDSRSGGHFPHQHLNGEMTSAAPTLYPFIFS